MVEKILSNISFVLVALFLPLVVFAVVVWKLNKN